MKSKFFSLKLGDWIKGLILAVLTAIVATVYELLQNSGLQFGWAEIKYIGTAALMAFLAYISKNLLTNSEGGFLKKDPPARLRQ